MMERPHYSIIAHWSSLLCFKKGAAIHGVIINLVEELAIDVSRWPAKRSLRSSGSLVRFLSENEGGAFSSHNF